MEISQILYSVVVFIISLLIHALSLFIASGLFKTPKRPTFKKAFGVLLKIYLTIFILWVIGQFIIYLLKQINVGLPTQTMVWIISVVIIVLSILYYYKELKTNYGLNFIQTVLLIILMWIINIAIIYLIDLFISPILNLTALPPLPLYDTFFSYHITL
jgi:hypothetical protein